MERGEKALDLHGAAAWPRPQLAGRQTPCRIADIALLAYTRLAHEGGFDLSAAANVRAWIARCEDVLGLEPAR